MTEEACEEAETKDEALETGVPPQLVIANAAKSKDKAKTFFFIYILLLLNICVN